MRNLSFLFLILSLPFFACNDDDADPGCLVQGDSLTLSDGTSATLVEIGDHRCPCEAACFWPGYIGITIIRSDGDTLIRVDEVFGNFPADTLINEPAAVYFLNNGDVLRLTDFLEPEGSCAGAVAGEDFCLFLEVQQ